MTDPHPNSAVPEPEKPEAAGLPKPKQRSLLLRGRDFLARHRLPVLVVAHICFFAFIYGFAFLIRFSLRGEVDSADSAAGSLFGVPQRYVDVFMQGLPWVILIKVAVFFSLRSFHGWWRHVNFSDFLSLVKSSVVATAVILLLDYFVFQLWSIRVPLAVLANDFFLTIVVIGGLRSCFRIWDERIAPLDRNRENKRALMVGDNYNAARMAHLMNGQSGLRTRVVGLVSPHPKAKGRRFSDLRVVGTLQNLEELMRAHRAKTLFVTTGTLQGKDLRALLESGSQVGFRIKILPSLEDQLRGLDRVPIRNVSYDDLLRRKPVSLDLDEIGKIIDGKTVLITGAGGSIGSELCRQLAKFQPEHMIFLGRGENRIYQIARELREIGDIKFSKVIANITDESRIEEIFAKYQPQLVFHAAAHKHVPLVEENVGESIVNNVLGTRVVADMAHKYKAERFVMVSTDKAVNPTSVMGCTKHMAERYCQSLGETSSTAFISTRFGNVLGSAGSVVPLFQEQIGKGGPITITDERMTRYFMTIPEASQLVLQASSMGCGGEIFVLEMGEPVKIIDLARDLIRLAGHSPGSIDIEVCGLRPGEKLYEELYYGDEKPLPTTHSKILSAHSRVCNYEEVKEQVRSLVEAAYGKPDEIKSMLQRFVPEFGGTHKSTMVPKMIDASAMKGLRNLTPTQN